MLKTIVLFFIFFIPYSYATPLVYSDTQKSELQKKINEFKILASNSVGENVVYSPYSTDRVRHMCDLLRSYGGFNGVGMNEEVAPDPAAQNPKIMQSHNFFLTERQLTKEQTEEVKRIYNTFFSDVISKRVLQHVNNTVSEITKGLITSVLDPVEIMIPPPFFIGVNAVYLKAKWDLICKDAAKDIKFQSPAGITNAPAVTTDDYKEIACAKREEYEMYSLPYQSEDQKNYRMNRYQMVFIVPNMGHTVKSILEQDALGFKIAKDIETAKSIQEMYPDYGDFSFTFPKFKIEQEHDLSIFFRSVPADVSVRQQVTIELNKEGVTAAAATDMVCYECASYSKHIKIKTEHLVLLMDTYTCTPLFFTKICNPTKSS